MTRLARARRALGAACASALVLLVPAATAPGVYEEVGDWLLARSRPSSP